MATDTANSQSNSIANMAQGGFTGGDAAVEVTCGFTPRRVELINVTDRIRQLWTDDMAATVTINIAADGTTTRNTGTLISAAAPETDGYRGFLVAAGAAVNAKVYVWTAWG